VFTKKKVTQTSGERVTPLKNELKREPLERGLTILVEIISKKSCQGGSFCNSIN